MRSKGSGETVIWACSSEPSLLTNVISAKGAKIFRAGPYMVPMTATKQSFLSDIPLLEHQRCQDDISMLCPSDIFFKIDFFRKNILGIRSVSNSLDPGQDHHLSCLI